ncbi:DUF333 domain-containing protein [Roseibium sediminicola]|uniref:DUF333 domain-containing protein n=1 Tax=Roseibium sediminicola TaxID=2933272 RepID=A0ABT0GXV7_9HYPH|nr:DUF333 domain-containing protein [Roseibium sp. CAU 1639]MCK7614267.1 DUF333 domain-containing protein [Roseibium sp. CAU 1639]
MAAHHPRYSIFQLSRVALPRSTFAGIFAFEQWLVRAADSRSARWKIPAAATRGIRMRPGIIPGLPAIILAASPALAAGEAAIANPASVFCVESGGKSVIEIEADGQRGYCILQDGTKVDEWEYFRENWDKTLNGKT